jgi:hypothetical protein
MSVISGRYLNLKLAPLNTLPGSQINTSNNANSVSQIPLKGKDRQSRIRHHTPIMAHLDTMEFDCSVCLETKEEDFEQVELVADNWICSKCVPAAIVQPFEAALRHEINYPPMWDPSTPLNYYNFQHLFARGFEEAWDEQIKEYKTPVQRRIYCRGQPIADDSQDEPEDARFCNNFLGELGKGDMVECMRCGIWTCLKCRLNPYAPPEDEHFCIPPKADDSAAGTFDPETRGKEWQQCPNPDCSVKLALRSGCNHMTCHFCSTDFCMLCGEEAAPGNGHWTRQQGCPRYGGLDVANPMFYDDPVPEEELDIVVGMVVLPHTDPPIAPIITLHRNNQPLADQRIMTTVWESFIDEIPRLQ